MIYRNSSISELAGRIESLEQHDEQSNLIPIKPEGSGIPFVCVHGDDANFFIPKYLSEQIPFYGYFHQGRNGERIRNTGIDSIAAKYVDELLKVRPTGPYIIGGYSIGGVIAQAMIPLIRGKGQEVILLVLIDTESPEYRGSRITGRKVFNDAEITLAGSEHISPAKRNNFWNRIVNSLKIRWFDFSYYIGLFFAVLSIKIPLSLRNSYIMGTYRRARRTFRPQPVHINTLLFRSTINNLDTYDLGWGRYLTGKLKIIETETDHNKIIKEPYIRHISAVLSCEISSMP
jgi:thioesterase domain-containing protein